jgi:hypothetical protein
MKGQRNIGLTTPLAISGPVATAWSPYKTYQPNAGLVLQVTESLSERTLVLPTGTAVGPPEISCTCDRIGFC